MVQRATALRTLEEGAAGGAQNEMDAQMRPEEAEEERLLLMTIKDEVAALMDQQGAGNSGGGLTLRQIRQHLWRKTGATAGKEYEKEWLKQEVGWLASMRRLVGEQERNEIQAAAARAGSTTSTQQRAQASPHGGRAIS